MMSDAVARIRRDSAACGDDDLALMPCLARLLEGIDHGANDQDVYELAKDVAKGYLR